MNLKKFILIACGIIGLLLTIILSLSDSLLKTSTIEDGPMEYLSAFFWLIGVIVIIAYIPRVHGKFKWMLIGLALFYFLCFGEEISWGQRILNYSVHTVESKSNQGEFNLHNLEIFSKNSFYDQLQDGKLNLLLLFNTQNIFRIVFLMLFGVLPFLLWMRKLNFIRVHLAENPPYFLYLCMTWVIQLFIWIVRFKMNSESRESLNEVEELWAALFAMLFILLILQPRKGNPSISSN